MAGIEKITAEIINEANLKADEILKSAKANANEIISSSAECAKMQENELLKAAEQKAEAIITSAESACQLDKKNKILSAKQSLINQCFDIALQKLRTLEKAEYFKVLSGLIICYALTGEGEIVLSDKDKNNLPTDFLASVNQKLGENKKVKISDKTDNKINGGFVIKYDEIEINCNFDKIILSEREALLDLVNAALFN